MDTGFDYIACHYPELYRQWMDGPTEVAFPNGESFSSLRIRVARSVATLIERHRGGCVTLVAHPKAD